jgi:NDP-sugar pyrophosphorylase family protein
VRARLLDAGSPESCQPVTSTRPLALCPVMNRPLAEMQRDRLSAAGFDVVEAGEKVSSALWVRGDAWLSEETLRRLRLSEGGLRLEEANGDLLAWIGETAECPSKADSLLPDETTFRIRYPWHLLRINEILLAGVSEDRNEGEISPAAHIDGRIVLGRGSRILPGVMIEGTVVVGENCKIGPNCYLRGSTSLGDGCHVGQAVEIKNSILMRKASIGHLSYCGDSIVGEGTNFGAGTITANFRHDGKSHRSMVGGELIDTKRRKFGAIFGDHVHTGIHTSIYPGRKLWPDMATLPGAIVKHDLKEPPCAE